MSRFRDSWDLILPVTEWIFTQDKGLLIMFSLQLRAVMLLYINQQLNVILYTYSFKRNSNQSLELSNLSARENDFQKSSLTCKPRASEPQRNKHFPRGKDLLYNFLWGQRSILLLPPWTYDAILGSLFAFAKLALSFVSKVILSTP